jgi:hypothetical protein
MEDSPAVWRVRVGLRSVADLQAAIDRFIEETNDDPKPFVWPTQTASSPPSKEGTKR